MKNWVGVITGDLISSSELTNEQKSNLNKDLSIFLGNNPDVLLPIQFYRGDSFQLMCKKEKAAVVAVVVEAIILSATGTLARISIGLGSTSKIAPNNVLQSEGEAFLLSGHQLDEMKVEGRLLKFAMNSALLQPIFDASFQLIESIIWGWKPGQASVISMIPQSKTQKIIAEKLNITGAAVSKALKSANWTAIDNFIHVFEQTINQL